MTIAIYKHNQELAAADLVKNQSGEYLIGRKNEEAVLSLDESQISRKHALLQYDGKDIFIIDLESTNGTFVNSKRLAGNEKVKITSNDIIRLGENSGIVLKIEEAVKEEQTILLQSTPKPKGNKEGAMWDRLQENGVVTIGRNTDADIVLTHKTVSRKHAMIEKKGNGIFILTDLNSTNGTYVNGNRISHPVEIKPADNIFIGRYSLGLQKEVKDLSAEIAVKARGIRKVYAENKVALQEVTFEINAKSLLAIMGPSGCGKSTLLKALNGDSPATSGSVHICGLELNSNYEFLKTLIGYVPQDDIIHMELTVEQCLTYAARIRLENADEVFIQQKVNEVLRQLNIEAIRYQLAGRISGGQRKRVSIAVELLNDPMILFLDEPTSPLDPQTIEEFLNILGELAKKGTTVVMVTHKTEDLHYMDSVIFMAEGGHMTYHGNTKNYLSHFGVQNTVQVYANLGGEHAHKWAASFKNKQPDFTYPGTSNPMDRGKQQTNYFKQYGWLTHRYFRIKLNDRVNTFIMIGQAPVIALLVCLIFKQVNQVVLFLMAISAVWFGANNAAREIVGEAAIYKRERMFNLGIFPYIFSKVTVLAAFAAIQSFLFTTIIMARYSPDWENFFGPFLWMLFLSVAATLLGLLLSAIANTTEKVMSIVPIVLIPQIMLSGVFVKIHSAFVECISYLTFTRWGTEGFCVLQPTIYVPATIMNPQTNMAELSATETVPVNALDYIGRQFYPDFHHLYGSLKADFIALLIISILLFIATWYFLKKKDSIKIS